MFSTTLIATLALSGLTLGELDFSKWAPPGHGDVRGPCPALNSLANHGFIPHDGRNITVATLTDAVVQAFTFSPEFAESVSVIGFNAKPEPRNGFFDLPDLNLHSFFEHDGSLSRDDLFFSGPDKVATFNQSRFDEFLAVFEGEDYITIESAAAARYKRIQHSRANTPDFTYEALNRIVSYSETVKYMKGMVDSTGKTKKEFVKILFEQQRLPFNEGWRPPVALLDGLTMAGACLDLALATPEKTLYFNEAPPAGQEKQTTWDVPGPKGFCEAQPNKTVSRRSSLVSRHRHGLGMGKLL